MFSSKWRTPAKRFKVRLKKSYSAEIKATISFVLIYLAIRKKKKEERDGGTKRQTDRDRE